MNDGLALSALWHGFAFAVGLSLGSFANVAIDRLPADRSVIPPSRCDTCGTRLGPRDLVPVLSWLWLRGRCRHCGAPIPAHLPLVELLVGLLSVLLWRRLVPGLHAIDAPHLAAWATYLGFLTLLVIATYVDIRHRIIPDEATVYAIPLGIGSAALLQWLGYDGWLAIPWREAVGGALFGGGMFALAAIVARGLRGTDALGWGDVKLVAMIGAFLGPLPGVMIVVLIGSVLGAVTGLAALVVLRARPWQPFGPSLALGAAAYVLYGREIVESLFPGLYAFIRAARG